MRPIGLGALALLMVMIPVLAAGADAPAAAPFPVVPLAQPARTPHTWAYVSIGAGVALVGASFALSRAADDRYADYLNATDPEQISSLYDQTARLDWAARASLVGGEVLLATGLYMRFLRHPHDDRVAFVVLPDRCALTVRF